GYSNSHSGQIELERRFSNGIAFQWFYTYNRSLSTSDVGGFTSGNVSINSGAQGGQVPANTELWGAPNLSYADRLKMVYFNSTEVAPHRIRYNFIYDLPVGHGKRFASNWGRAADAVIGGWEIAGIGDWRSGFWRTIATSRYQFGDPRLDASQRVEMTIF